MTAGRTSPRWRLDRLLSHAAGISRRGAAAEIRAGQVWVNGREVTRDDEPVDPVGDQVCWRGQAVRLPGHVVLVQHKPAGVVSATAGEPGRTVIDLVPVPLRRPGLAPVGRLDRDTTGLLILTTDGDLNHRLTHPRHHVGKVYLADLARPLPADAAQRLADGLVLDDGPCLPASLATQTPLQVRLTVREGRFHQVKRMVMALGSEVTHLHRERFGALELPADLLPGQTRELTAGERVLLLGEYPADPSGAPG